jgi:hypothetical protein
MGNTVKWLELVSDWNAFIIYAEKLLHSLCIMSSGIGITDCVNQFQHFILLIHFQTNLWNENRYELLKCIMKFYTHLVTLCV